jgi:hypothetical protein
MPAGLDRNFVIRTSFEQGIRISSMDGILMKFTAVSELLVASSKFGRFLKNLTHSKEAKSALLSLPECSSIYAEGRGPLSLCQREMDLLQE